MKLKQGVTYDPTTKTATVDTGVYNGVVPQSKWGYTVQSKPQAPVNTGSSWSAYWDFVAKNGSENDTNYVPPPAPTWPVPWSADSLFEWEDPRITAYWKSQEEAANAPIDEEEIKRKALEERQRQIDATNAVYADILQQAKVTGQGRIGTNTAQMARGGLIGSDFGNAQANTVEAANNDIYKTVDLERNAAVQAIMTEARNSAENDIKEKRLAKEAGATAFTNYLAGAGERKAKKSKETAISLLRKWLLTKDVSDEALKLAGITRNDLENAFYDVQAEEASANAKATAETQKTSLEAAKTQAEIAQINAAIAKATTEWSKYYEVGNKIYETGTNKYISDAVFNPNNPFQVTPWNAIYDPVKWTFVTAPVTGGATGDLRSYRSQYPNEAWSGTNNPWGITVNPTFTQTLQNAGIQVESSSPRPKAEGGSYYVFPTIEEGMKAYDLLWSSPSYKNLSVGQALARWGTGSLPWVNANKKVSDLSSDELANLKMVQIKKESPWLYKVLTTTPPLTKDQQNKILSYSKALDSSPAVSSWKKIQWPLKWLDSVETVDLNGSDIQGLVSNYAKILDPDSVVRESEYAIAQSGASKGAADKIRQSILSYMYGGSEVLSEPAQKVLKDALKRRFNSMRIAYQEEVGRQQTRAEEILGIPVTEKMLVWENLTQESSAPPPEQIGTNADGTPMYAGGQTGWDNAWTSPGWKTFNFN